MTAIQQAIQQANAIWDAKVARGQVVFAAWSDAARKSAAESRHAHLAGKSFPDASRALTESGFRSLGGVGGERHYSNSANERIKLHVNSGMVHKVEEWKSEETPVRKELSYDERVKIGRHHASDAAPSLESIYAKGN